MQVRVLRTELTRAFRSAEESPCLRGATYQKEWKQRNKFKAFCNSARQRGTPVLLTEEEYLDLLDIQNCPVCGDAFSNSSINDVRSMDRLDPCESYTNTNTWCICYKCNRRKSDMSLEWMAELILKVLDRKQLLKERYK